MDAGKKGECQRINCKLPESRAGEMICNYFMKNRDRMR